MHNHRPLWYLATRALLALALLGAALIAANASAGATAQTAPQAAPFKIVKLPPAALAATAGFAAPRAKSQNPKLDSTMDRLAARARSSLGDAIDLARAQSLRLSGGQVHAQIVIRAGSLAAVRQAIGQAGGTVSGAANDDTLLQGWLPIGALTALAARDDVLMVRQPLEAEPLEQPQAGGSTTEGLPAINAAAWHAVGWVGAGVKVGVIDVGFSGYPGLLGGDLPASVTVKNFVDGETDAQVNAGGSHGAACAEIVHDVAPGAKLFLAKIGTNVDLAEAVAWLKDTQHVQVISTSLGWYNLTPGDGTGEFAALVSQARAAGILWVTAAGNDREAHWGGAFNDSDNDGFHNFNTSQNRYNYFGPGDGNAYAIPAGAAFRVFLRWDDWVSHDQDYDLYLYRWNGSAWVQIASSQNPQNGGPGQTPTEYAAITTSGDPAIYGFAIRRVSGNRNLNLEVFAPKIAPLADRVHARSLANLADAPDAVTVAAVDVHSPYPQESYSSEGPTNGPGGAETGGAAKPDISGYANVSTASYGPGMFSGTSAATPHVAGAAALVLSANATYTINQIETLLQGRAVDLGAGGFDTLFGYGRLSLGAPDISFRLDIPLMTR